MGDQPTTPLEVSRYIGQVLRRKRQLLDQARDADQAARDARREADREEARAFLRAQGSVDARKAAVDLDDTVDKMRQAADVAEVAVRYTRGLLAHCADEIDGARTAAATLRAEFSVLGMADEGA